MKLWKKLLQNLLLPNLESMASRPYHNLAHMLYVKNMIDEIELSGHYIRGTIDFESLRAAAICHDIGHAGGAVHDAVNIRNAKAIVSDSKILDDYPKKDFILELISNTEYPYTKEPDDISLEGRLLRDADVSMCYHTDYFNNVFLPLSIEMNIPRDIESLKKFLLNSKVFIETRDWQTTWGHWKWMNNQYIFTRNLEIVDNLLEL